MNFIHSFDLIMSSGHTGVCCKCDVDVCLSVDRSLKRRQVKPLAASLLDVLDYDSSDDSDFEVGEASGKHSELLLVMSSVRE